MYSIMKYKHILSYFWDIEKIKKYGIGPFCPDPGAKRNTLCHFAPNDGMFHCINVVQAVLWLIRLINLRLAQVIAPVKNNDGTKSKHSLHFGQYIKTIKIFVMDYLRLFSLKHAMLSSMNTNSSYFQVTGCYLVTFVWCYSICEMRKCFNFDLRGTSIFPQCEKGSNVLATIYVCQWVQALHDFPCICRITTMTIDSLRWGSNSGIRFEFYIYFW